MSLRISVRNEIANLRDLKCAKPGLTTAGVAKHRNYDWPGNVRELRNVIECVIILSRGDVLHLDLPGLAAAATATPA